MVGLIESIKRGLGKRKEERMESQRLDQDLRKRIKKAKREVFDKEAIKAAKIQAKLQAQQRFNPKVNANVGGFRNFGKNVPSERSLVADIRSERNQDFERDPTNTNRIKPLDEDLMMKVKKAKKQVFEKEIIKDAKIQARLQAQKRLNLMKEGKQKKKSNIRDILNM